ncbi:MAG TPA: arginase family protein [Actinomycetota bacterium]|nr:arginase family protein [Actinomycetota bacterium]
MSSFAVIGVPIDSVGRAGGTEYAPAALRELGILPALDARDAGDLDVRIRGEVRDPDTGIVGSSDVLTATAAIREAVRSSVAAGDRPFLLGGCCAELPGALAGARDAVGRLGLAYLDGHLDLYDGRTSPTGEAADMPVAAALGIGPAAWVDACGGPSVDAPDVRILGYRDLDQSLDDGMVDPRAIEGLGLADVDAVREAPAEIGTQAAAELAAGPGRFWFHLDVDVLDEVVFPATDYLFPGGLTWDELQPLLDPLLSSPDLLGASIGCYNPTKDADRRDGLALVGALRLAVG